MSVATAGGLIAPSHDVFSAANLPYRISDDWATPQGAATVKPAQGFYLGGKLVVFVSRGELAKAWTEKRTEQTEAAYRMGINLLSYALQR